MNPVSRFRSPLAGDSPDPPPIATVANSSTRVLMNVRIVFSAAICSTSSLNRSNEPRPTKAMRSAAIGWRPVGSMKISPTCAENIRRRREVADRTSHTPVERARGARRRDVAEDAERDRPGVDLGDAAEGDPEIDAVLPAPADDHALERVSIAGQDRLAARQRRCRCGHGHGRDLVARVRSGDVVDQVPHFPLAQNAAAPALVGIDAQRLFAHRAGRLAAYGAGV
jgi:hypothetical protein